MFFLLDSTLLDPLLCEPIFHGYVFGLHLEPLFLFYQNHEFKLNHEFKECVCIIFKLDHKCTQV